MNFGIDTWILIVLTAICAFAAVYFPIKHDKGRTPQRKSMNLPLKKKTFYWIVSIITF